MPARMIPAMMAKRKPLPLIRLAIWIMTVSESELFSSMGMAPDFDTE